MKKAFENFVILLTMTFDRWSKAWDNLIKRLKINKDENQL